MNHVKKGKTTEHPPPPPKGALVADALTKLPQHPRSRNVAVAPTVWAKPLLLSLGVGSEGELGSSVPTETPTRTGLWGGTRGGCPRIGHHTGQKGGVGALISSSANV